PLQTEIEAVNRALAQTSLLAALGSIARLISARAVLPEPAQDGASAPASAPPRGASDVIPHWQANIARYHREHERYYVQDRSALAADLHREAAKLKIVAEAWLGARPAQPDPSIDFFDQTYAPVGCVDLNALSAIAT